MVIPITKNLINQLPKAIKEHEGEWCELTCEIESKKYIKINGVLEITKQNTIRFAGKDDFIAEITYNHFSNSPIIISNLGKYNEVHHELVNLELISNWSGLKISNNWEPPREVKFPNQRKVAFDISTELEVNEVMDIFKKNIGSAVKISLKYFDEEIDTLYEYLNKNKVGEPGTKNIEFNCKIINANKLITDQNESLIIFFNQALGSGMILGLAFKDEIAFADLAYKLHK